MTVTKANVVHKHYCYRIDFEDSFVYFGVRTCRCDPAEDTNYMGSPKTYKAKWLTDIPRVKTIVSEHATREQAGIAEDKLILAFWARSGKGLSLNASISGAKFNKAGTKLSDEHKAKIGAASAGRKHTEEARASMSAAATGYRWYTDGATSIKLKHDDAVPEGFVPGLADEHCAKLSGKKWYTDGATSITLKLGSAIPEGFSPGMAAETGIKVSKAKAGKKLGPLSDKHRASIGAANKGKPKPPRSAEHCAKLAASKGFKWYTDGATIIKVKSSESAPEGFKPGRRLA